MKPTRTIQTTDQQRAVLRRWSRGRSVAARLVLRARIILLAAELKTAPKAALLWQTPSADKRLPGLKTMRRAADAIHENANTSPGSEEPG